MRADEEGIDVLEVLHDIYGIEGTPNNAEEFITFCPKHEVEGDHSPSASINIRTGLWRCFSCGAKGDLISFGKLYLQRSYSDVAALIVDEGPDADLARARRTLRGLQKAISGPQTTKRPTCATQRFPWLPEDARTTDAYSSRPLDYMIERGFTVDTCQRFSVRYARSATVAMSKRSIEIRNVIAIPITFDGEVFAWCYRKTHLSPDWQPRYLYSYGAPLGDVLFGADLVEDNWTVITEGALDAMWVTQAGLPAVAQLGSQLSETQARRLQDFRKVVLFYDRDRAGRTAAYRIGQRIWDKVPTFVVTYPRTIDGSDPAELGSCDIERLVARARPWQSWSLRRSLP